MDGFFQYQDDPIMQEDFDLLREGLNSNNIEPAIASEAKPRKKKKIVSKAESAEKDSKELHHFNLAIDKELFRFLKTASAFEGISVTDFIINATTKELVSKYKDFDIRKFLER